MGGKGILERHKYLILILIATFLIRLAPALIFQPLIGLDTYFHKDVAAQFLTGELSVSNVFDIKNILAGQYPLLFHFIVSSLSNLGISLFTLFKFLPPFLSVIIVLLFYYFSREFLEVRRNLTISLPSSLRSEEKYALLATLLFSTAPIVILRTAQTIPETFSLLFFIPALIFLVRFYKGKNYLNLLLFFLFGGLQFLTHRSVFFLGIIFLIAILTLFGNKKLWVLTGAGFAAISAFIIYTGAYQSVIDFMERLAWDPVTAKGYVLATGIMMLPAFAGIALAWNKRTERKNQFLLMWTLIFAAVGMMSFRFRDPFLMFPVAIFAAIGIYDYVQPAFAKHYKKLLYGLLILIFVQSIVTVAIALPVPKGGEYGGLAWIKDNTPTDSIVLSGREEGYWVVGIAERRDLILWKSLYQGLYGKPATAAESRANYEDALKMLRSSNETLAYELMEKYGVDYIYIDKKMHEEQDSFKFGLTEYINTSEKFEWVYEKDNTTVHRFVKN